jgi:energy-coupling factor transporter ATP-binding protein EcfA2
VAGRCRIEIAGLRKSFLAEGREVVAVDDASFSIDDGEFVALLGPSGCGKSTILNMVATLIAPNGGGIRVDGEPGFLAADPHIGYVSRRTRCSPGAPSRTISAMGSSWRAFPQPSAASGSSAPSTRPVSTASAASIPPRCRAACASACR